MAIVQVDFSQFLKQADQFTTATKGNIRQAGRRAISRGLTKAVKLSSQELQKEYYLKASEIKENIKVSPPKGRDLSGIFWISGKSLSLSRFLVSPKSYVSQERVPVRKRQPVRVRIKKNAPVITLRQAFLVSVGRDKLQVFRRTKGSSSKKNKKGQWTQLPINKMSTTSLAHTYAMKNMFERSRPEVMLHLGSTFYSTLKYLTEQSTK
jgi:hypothetical protein